MIGIFSYPDVRNRPLFLAASLAPLLAVHAHAFESGKRIEITGPVSADIIRVIEGDTILVAAKPGPQQTMEVYVRLRGIDAPELKSSCAATRCRPASVCRLD